MHEYMMRSLVDQQRHRLMAEANVHRHVTAARGAPAQRSARSVRDAIWAPGSLLAVRPIASDDADRVTRLFGRLSPRSIQLRFFSPIRRLSSGQIARMVDVDHELREALVALSNDEIVAIARYDGPRESRRAEIAVTVEDTWQHRGIGKRLTHRLSTLAVARGYDTFVARILPENRAALNLVRKLAPDISVRWNDGEYEALIPLVRG